MNELKLDHDNALDIRYNDDCKSTLNIYFIVSNYDIKVQQSGAGNPDQEKEMMTVSGDYLSHKDLEIVRAEMAKG